MKLIPEDSKCLYHTGLYGAKARAVLNILDFFSKEGMFAKVLNRSNATLVENFTIEEHFELLEDYVIVSAVDNELLIEDFWHREIDPEIMRKFLRRACVHLANQLKKSGVTEKDEFFFLVDTDTCYRRKFGDIYQSYNLNELKERELLTLKDIRNLGRKEDRTGMLIDPFILELKRECMSAIRDSFDLIEDRIDTIAPNLLSYLPSSSYRPIEYMLTYDVEWSFIRAAEKDCILKQLKKIIDECEFDEEDDIISKKKLQMDYDRIVKDKEYNRIYRRFSEAIDALAKRMNIHWLMLDIYRMSD